MAQNLKSPAFSENSPTSPRPRRRIFLMAGMVFCLVLAWSVLLLQGLPASDIDDWYRVIMARQTNWNTLTSSFLRPWSLCPSWDGQTESLDGIHTKRILNPIVLKLSQQFFGSSSFAMYFFAKALFFAGSVSIVFLLLAQVVPWLYAIFGTIVFLLVPAHYTHVLWIADAATLCYFFLFLGILIFHVIQKNILECGSKKQFGWLLLALFVVGWSGIKTKESMLVLPLVVILYSLTCFRAWKKAPVKFALLNAAMVFVAFQIIPVTNLNAGSVPSVHFNFGTICRLFLRNYECGYDTETASAFFSWKHIFPVSIARTLGFFMLWTMIISLGCLGWQKWILKNKGAIPFWGHPLIRICGIWFLVELPFLGMFQADPRYFSGTMAPIIILVARVAYCAIKGIGRFFGAGLLILWFFSAGFNIYENVQNSLSVRIMLGRKFSYLLETARVVLEDLTGQKVSDNLEVGKFYGSIRRDDPSETKIENYVFYADLGISYDGWNRVPAGQNSMENYGRYAKNGYRYYISVKELDLSATPRIKQIGIVDGINRQSLLEKLLFKKKKKQPSKVRIYKYE